MSRRLRSFIAVAVALTGALGAGACGATGSSAIVHSSGPAGGAPGRWSAPVPVPGVRSINAVSCPVAGWCLVVTNKQYLVYDHGTWSPPRTIEFGHPKTMEPPAIAKLAPLLNSVSCVSRNLCRAGDDAGRIFTFDGRRWTHSGSIDIDGVGELSCESASFCAALDDNGGLLMFNNGRWSVPSNGPGGNAISCTAGPFCMAVDSGNGDNWVYEGSRWHDAGAGTLPTNLALHGGSEPEVPDAVACASPDLCAVVDNFGVAWVWSDGVYSAGYQFDPGLLDVGSSVACPSSQLCRVIDGNDMASTWNGHSWSRRLSVDGRDAGVEDLSCPGAQFCMAVDGAGRALIWSS